MAFPEQKTKQFTLSKLLVRLNPSFISIHHLTFVLLGVLNVQKVVVELMILNKLLKLDSKLTNNNPNQSLKCIRSLEKLEKLMDQVIPYKSGRRHAKLCYLRFRLLLDLKFLVKLHLEVL
jgi:hypothetical protein